MQGQGPLVDVCMVKKEMAKTVCEDTGDDGLPPMKIARNV
jgi:hypothetical protein